MKKLSFILLLNILSCPLYAQYVTKKDGDRWGINEYKYQELGDKMEKYISQNMYHSAIECLAEMFSIKCTNANREKDLYAFIFCTLELDEYDTLIEIASTYEKAFPNSPRLYVVIGNKGFAYALGKKDYKYAIFCLEKALSLAPATDYGTRSKYCEVIAESYSILDNDLLSRKFYKKSILYFMKEENTSITNIESFGINSPHLGKLFLDYRSTYTEDYNVFMYLNYLAAKCQEPKARDEYSFLLKDDSYKIYKSKVPADLFDD